MERAPFVSGLARPGAAEPPTPNRKGYEQLLAIREQAEANLRVLQPLTLRCFDGERWIDPEADDVRAAEAAAAAKRLVDLIISDRVVCALITARLAGAHGGVPGGGRR
jgi:hypothetical protein